MVAMFAMVDTDALIVGTALRFVEVGASSLPAAGVLGVFLLTYPLTILHLSGLGVLDALLVAAWTATAGIDPEPEIVAGVVVWRAVTLLGPLLLGVLSTYAWRRRHRAGRSASAGRSGSPDR